MTAKEMFEKIGYERNDNGINVHFEDNFEYSTREKYEIIE